MSRKNNWLERQLNGSSEDVKSWPEWAQRLRNQPESASSAEGGGEDTGEGNATDGGGGRENCELRGCLAILEPPGEIENRESGGKTLSSRHPVYPQPRYGGGGVDPVRRT